MTGSRMNRRTAAALAGAVGTVSLLFFPFAGFTERTAYAPSPIFRDYGLAGIGTYGQEFNPFGYASWLGFIQVGMLAGAIVALGYATVRARRGSRSQSSGRIAWWVAGSSLVLALAALLIVFPAVDEGTIWVTGATGWVETWWVDYGTFVSPAAAAATAWLLGRDAGPSPAPPAAAGPNPTAPPKPPPVE